MLIQPKVSIKDDQTSTIGLLCCLLGQEDHIFLDILLQLLITLRVDTEGYFILLALKYGLLGLHVDEIAVGCVVSSCEQTKR